MTVGATRMPPAFKCKSGWGRHVKVWVDAQGKIEDEIKLAELAQGFVEDLSKSGDYLRTKAVIDGAGASKANGANGSGSGIQSVGAKQAIDEENRQIRFVASSESEDLDGDVIRQSGWSFESFQNNPVFLWSHDMGMGSSIPAIGTITEFGVEANQLLITVRFAKGEDYPFADTIFRLYVDRILNGVSVGFVPTEMQIMVDEDGMIEGVEFIEQVLLEVSSVNIPANPEALITEMMSKGYDGRMIQNAGQALGMEQTSLPLLGSGTPSTRSKGTDPTGGRHVSSPRWSQRGPSAANSVRKGEQLADFLNDRIDELATEDRPRSQIIEEMADAAGIEPTTVEQILRAGITCPPLERLEGFADVLDVSVDRLVREAGSDGCDYSESESGQRCQDCNDADPTRLASTQDGVFCLACLRARLDIGQALANQAGVSASELAKSVVSYQNWPLGPRDAAWNGDAADGRLRRWASEDGSGDKEQVNWTSYRNGHVIYDRSDDPDFGDFKLNIVDILDADMERTPEGSPRAMPRGIFAAAVVLEGGRGGVDPFDDGDIDGAKNHLTRYYEKMRNEFDDPDLIAPWEEESEEGARPSRFRAEEIDAFLEAFGLSMGDLQVLDGGPSDNGTDEVARLRQQVDQWVRAYDDLKSKYRFAVSLLETRTGDLESAGDHDA